MQRTEWLITFFLRNLLRQRTDTSNSTNTFNNHILALRTILEPCQLLRKFHVCTERSNTISEMTIPWMYSKPSKNKELDYKRQLRKQVEWNTDLVGLDIGSLFQTKQFHGFMTVRNEETFFTEALSGLKRDDCGRRHFFPSSSSIITAMLKQHAVEE